MITAPHCSNLFSEHTLILWTRVYYQIDTSTLALTKHTVASRMWDHLGKRGELGDGEV